MASLSRGELRWAQQNTEGWLMESGDLIQLKSTGRGRVGDWNARCKTPTPCPGPRQVPSHQFKAALDHETRFCAYGPTSSLNASLACIDGARPSPPNVTLGGSFSQRNTNFVIEKNPVELARG